MRDLPFQIRVVLQRGRYNEIHECSCGFEIEFYYAWLVECFCSSSLAFEFGVDISNSQEFENTEEQHEIIEREETYWD